MPFELNGTGLISSHCPSVFLYLFYLVFLQCVLYAAINQGTCSTPIFEMCCAIRIHCLVPLDMLLVISFLISNPTEAKKFISKLMIPHMMLKMSMRNLSFLCQFCNPSLTQVLDLKESICMSCFWSFWEESICQLNLTKRVQRGEY